MRPEEGGETEDLAWEDDLCREENDLLLLSLLVLLLSLSSLYDWRGRLEEDLGLAACLGVAGPDGREWEERGEDLDDFLPGPRSVRTGVICLALLATVLENSLLEMEELVAVVAVGDLVALLDLYPMELQFSLPGETEPLLTELHLGLPPVFPPARLSLSCLSRVFCLSVLLSSCLKL